MLGPKKKILIVEDDTTLRNVLSENLSSDYEIAQAGDGKQGLTFVLDFKPDLVLLDLLLPQLPGLEMLERVRSYPDAAVANTKVIIFTNFSSPEYITKAQKLNVTDYLLKSSTPVKDLISKIEEVLNKPS